MPDPPVHPVKPLREHLFQPLHDLREFKPVRRQNVERKPIILKPQSTDHEPILPFRLTEDPGEQGHGVMPPEQGFPVVNTGTYFIPNTLSE
jgi:hypothetical protein